MRIFIGWDGRFPEPGRVLAHSLRKHSSACLGIDFLDYRHLQDCYGFNRTHDPLASTEFTYSRFLVPWLLGYAEDLVVVMDSDMLCLGDPYDLLRGKLKPYVDLLEAGAGKKAWDVLPALWVVKHNHQVVDGSKKMYGAVQTAYPRKNWSSLMVMNCAKLRCWTKEVVETAPGSRLHRFEDIPDHLIGDLDPDWNVLDTPTPTTKMLHWTSGGPWLEQYKDVPMADLWRRTREEAYAR